MFFPSHTTTQAVLASGGSIYIKYELFHIGLVEILDLFFLIFHYLLQIEYTISGVLALYSAWFDRNCKESLAFITDTATRLVKKGLSAYVSEDKLTKPVSKSKSSNR